MPKDKITKDWIATQRARAEMAEFVDTVTFIEAMDALEEALRGNERLRGALEDILNTEAMLMNAGCKGGIAEDLKAEARVALQLGRSVPKKPNLSVLPPR